MKPAPILAAVAACAAQFLPFAPSVHAQTTQAAPTSTASALPDTDRKFVEAASMAGSTEIDAARLALHQSSDKGVKSFARRMIADHTRLAQQLKMAAPHGVEVPKDNPDTSVLDSLKPLKGAAFDSAYVQKVGVAGHQQAIATFQDEISNGQNAKLKSAAQKALPTIQHHYAMAKDLSKK